MTNVRDYGARGDGVSDDTAAITHAIQRGDGHLVFPPGEYLISRSLYIPLQLHGRIAIDGSGGTAKLVMTDSGPAIHLVGSHRRSALPEHFTDDIWIRERLPTVQGIEIEGRHPQADGIRIEGSMQPTLRTALIRKVRNGIHLLNRDRNVLIADCHIYNNTGIGLFLDHVNLHQINIHGNHISYNKQGGLRIAGSEIRNIQICSNDIEYNHDLKAESSADVFFDCREGTVREGTIVGNTIQAVGTPGGANVRLIGAKDHPNSVGLLAITGNLLGSQTRVLDLHHCRGVAISGNSIYSGYRHAIWAENAEHLVIGSNTIDRNPEYRGNSTDQLVFRGCRNVNLSGVILQHSRAATEPVEASMLFHRCSNVNITGVQIVNARTRGIEFEGCSIVRVADSTISGPPNDPGYRGALRLGKDCRQMMIVNNFLGRGDDGAFQMPQAAGTASGNVELP